MKPVLVIGGAAGLAALVALMLRADLAAMWQALGLAGWRLLWLVPYRAIYFLLYAFGWLALLRSCDPLRRAGLGYVLWVTTVREGIDRLLPVASIGCGVAGVRLMRWRGLACAPIAASVIVEILLTLIVMYLFTALGLLLLANLRYSGADLRHLAQVFVWSLPVPVVTILLLRFGSLFTRLEGVLGAVVWSAGLAEGAAALDRELRASLHRSWALVPAGALQLAAFVSGSFEVWLALRLFGHPVSVVTALVLESMTQAVRHLAFFIPAGLGVQEAALVVFGQVLGVNNELALAVSMAKRRREVLCGIPALASWQWMEGRRSLSAQAGRSGGS